ncbi:hypothetical protein ACHAW5_006706 [Stephanodiscus triporus]|uniref:Uncharacterized protein n=1 Tax=Stephanodiscus triporus TaxID=2934178 RepID=A0ABD3NIY0_9STRA
MWPMSWSADVETLSMAYGIDDVMHTSKGTTYYMLDRNWKRSDTTYRQVYFVTWKEADVDAGEDPVLPGETDASRIEECQFIDLVVIGNIRPDWFLDKRGDDTDVQYLGNQHVYYADADNSTVPRLVKQWRKKDFASQYFTMSIMGNPPNKLKQDANASIEENIHWPLILNIPGEGFGDDMLQVYRNHRLLDSEVDAGLFQIIENYEALGFSCVDLGANASDGDGAQFGPPVLEEEEKIPSNLEVDPMSWFSNEYTFSPVWDASSSTASAVDQSPSSSSSGSALAIEVSDRLTVESCTDGLGSISFTAHFHDVEPTDDGLLPWMAIGYRTGELCAMTPPDGGTTPIVLLMQTDAGSAPVAHKTLLLPEAKGASDAAFSSMMASMKNLEDEDDYSDLQVMTMSSTAVEVSRSSSSLGGEEGTVSLYFKHTPVEAAIAGGTMYYTYAIGSTSQMGYHVTRGCFEVSPTPCGGGEEGDVDEEDEDANSDRDVGYMSDPAPSSNDVGSARGTVFALSAIAAALIGR